jgi:hypothetical protein
VWRITGSTGTPEAAIFQGNVDTSLDPPALNPTAWDVEDTLWLALSSSDDATSTVTGFPTSYTGTGQVNAADSADGVTLGYAVRANATASEDPSPFTISAAEAFCTVTVGIRPVPDYPTLQAEGTQPANVTTGNLTLTLPTHQADDILVAIVAIWAPNTAGSLAAIPALTDWTKQGAVNFPGTPDGEIAFFWRRATASGTTNPTFTRGASWDTGTDTAYGGRAFVIRGCVTTGDPWDEFDPTAALTGANGSVDAVTVSAAKRTVIQFLGKTDDFVTGPTVSGWTPGVQTEQTAGTDTSFGTFRKENVSASTTADASTVEAPVAGAYVFFGVSFKPPVTGTPPVAALAEIDALLSTSKSSDRAAVLLAETDVLVTASRTHTLEATALAELDVLQPVARTGAPTITALAEVDVLSAVARSSVQTVAVLTEADALTAAPAVHAQTVTLLADAEQLLSVTKASDRPAGLLTEVDALLTVARSSSYQLGSWAEVDALVAGQRSGSQLAGVLAELDALEALAAPDAVGALAEIDQLLAVGHETTRPVTLLSEIDGLLVVQRSTTQAVSLLSELEQLLAPTRATEQSAALLSELNALLAPIVVVVDVQVTVGELRRRLVVLDPARKKRTIGVLDHRARPGELRAHSIQGELTRRYDVGELEDEL